MLDRSNPDRRRWPNPMLLVESWRGVFIPRILAKGGNAAGFIVTNQIACPARRSGAPFAHYPFLYHVSYHTSAYLYHVWSSAHGSPAGVAFSLSCILGPCLFPFR